MVALGVNCLSYNLITIVLLLVVLLSIAFGVRRRFGEEMRVVIMQAISVLSGITAIFIAWFTSHALSAFVIHQKVGHLPTWLAQFLTMWQRSPQVAMWITFGILYFLFSNTLHRLLANPAQLAVRLIPTGLGRSRWLGGAVGGVAGAVRALAVGAVAFLVMQYFSVGQLAAQAKTSTVYRYLASNVYRPWLQPLVSRELPVLAEGALEPLSQNISLFAVPTGVNGEERGVLIVPAVIADKAKQIVSASHATTARAQAHALYEWEIHNVGYDWKKYNDFVSRGQWDQQSPQQTLQTHKGVCADYALLYADMAHAVGLDVQIIEGIGGTQQQNGAHAWNAVRNPATGQWMLVDTTWGSSQDAWFDVPPAQFAQMHVAQTTITIPGNHS